MKIRLTIEVDDEYRRAINHVLGKPGKATRAEVIAHVDMVMRSDISELCFEADQTAEGKRLRKEWGLS